MGFINRLPLSSLAASIASSARHQQIDEHVDRAVIAFLAGVQIPDKNKAVERHEEDMGETCAAHVAAPIFRLCRQHHGLNALLRRAQQFRAIAFRPVNGRDRLHEIMRKAAILGRDVAP